MSSARFFSLSSISNGGEGQGEEARFLGASFHSRTRGHLSATLSSIPNGGRGEEVSVALRDGVGPPKPGQVVGGLRFVLLHSNWP